MDRIVNSNHKKQNSILHKAYFAASGDCFKSTRMVSALYQSTPIGNIATICST